MANWEYWAGFFDGEGCVTINIRGQVQVSVSQKYPEILNLLLEDFGKGRIDPKSTRVNYGYAWRLTGKQNILEFFDKIYPYSIVKKKDIDLGRKALSFIRDNNQGCNPLSSDELNERMKVRDELLSTRPKNHITMSEEYRIRNQIKEECDYRCVVCGESLRNKPVNCQIISGGKLICNKCHAHRSIAEFKHVSKEEIEEALNTSDSIKEAAQKLGLARSSLGIKRKKFGLSLHPHKYLRTINRGYKEKKPVDPEKKKEWDRLYYQKHKEELIAKQKEYYERNRDKVLEYHKELYLKQKTKGGRLSDEGSHLQLLGK